jgi:hypothetical protein
MPRCCGVRVIGRSWTRGKPDSLAAYMRNDAPAPWASGAGQRQIARGVPGADGSLHFQFRRGDPVYKQLVSTPGLSAIITVDRGTSRILGVTFRGRRLAHLRPDRG